MRNIFYSLTGIMLLLGITACSEEETVVNSRYSIVIAAAKRARQIIDGAEPLIASKRNK